MDLEDFEKMSLSQVTELVKSENTPMHLLTLEGHRTTWIVDIREKPLVGTMSFSIPVRSGLDGDRFLAEYRRIFRAYKNNNVILLSGREDRENENLARAILALRPLTKQKHHITVYTFKNP